MKRSGISWLPICCGFYLGLLVFFPGTSFADTNLTVQTLRPENGQVEITSSANNLTNKSVTDLEKRSDVARVDTRNHKFRLYVDLSNITPYKDAYYLYDIYVSRLANGPQLPIGYRLQAEPIGSFSDGWREITFEIQAGSEADSGTIRIPIHSFTPVDALIPDNSLTKIHEVALAQESTIQVRLRNVLEDIGITVDPKAEISTEQSGYWKKLEITSPNGRTILTVPKSSTADVFELKIQPDAFQALTASLPPLRDGSAHTELTVNINYHVDHGGGDRRFELHIPIRFVPSIWSLLLIVLLGACVGTVFCSLLPSGHKKGNLKSSSFIAAIALGMIVEVVGMILIANNSKLILLGLELDPFQLLTSFMIGVICGGLVVWRGDAIKDFFARLTRANKVPEGAA
jgi:hypothetical protein